MVVLDDVGFGQLGCYGSTIATPVIDRLAGNGIRLANFHTTALCSPTPRLSLDREESPPQRNGTGSRSGCRLSWILGQTSSREWIPLRGPASIRVTPRMQSENGT